MLRDNLFWPQQTTISFSFCQPCTARLFVRLLQDKKERSLSPKRAHLFGQTVSKLFLKLFQFSPDPITPIGTHPRQASSFFSSTYYLSSHPST